MPETLSVKNTKPIEDSENSLQKSDLRVSTAMADLCPIIRMRLLLTWSFCVLFCMSGCSTSRESGVRKTSTTFTRIVLDPGHGGHDLGARSRKGLQEKDIALDVVQRLEPKLRTAGLRTVLTRNSDVFIPLDRRVELSDREQSAVFLSVHFNDAGRKQVSGMESYYFSEESRRFAQRLVSTLSRGTGAPDRGSRVARFRVLRNNLNPAVLVECGYLSSRTEAALLSQPAYREKIATALAEAIIKQRGGPVQTPAQKLTLPQNVASLGENAQADSENHFTARSAP